jgi:hypothetical protein
VVAAAAVCGFGPCGWVAVVVVALTVVGVVVGVLASSGGHHANGAPTPMPMPPQPQCQERMDGCCQQGQCYGCKGNSDCWTVCCINPYPGPGPAPH